MKGDSFAEALRADAASVEALIARAVAAERERAAKIAERYKTVYAKGPKAIAAAIRGKDHG